MQYLVAFQLLCGCFSAFVAGRKGRSRVAWWLVGVLVPVFGVVLSLMIGEPSVETQPARRRESRGRRARKPPPRPKRCRGRYQPDCLGCPYFRRPLFDAERTAGMKGTCTFFGRELVDETEAENSHVAIDES